MKHENRFRVNLGRQRRRRGRERFGRRQIIEFYI